MHVSTAHRVTKAEIAIAKETDLPDLLSSLGYQVKRIGSYHTSKEMDSLRIKDRRTWFRYSEGIGGDTISFLQRFENKSFPEAVEYLLAYQGSSRDPPEQPPKQSPTREKGPFQLPPSYQNQRCTGQAFL